jgi:penicillin-binding protein 1A
MVVRNQKGKVNVVLFVVAVVLAVIAGAGVGTFAAFIEESPQLRLLDEWRPSVNTRIYAADGSLVKEFAEERRTLVQLSEVPLDLQHAFIAAEDKRFYDHSGIDFLALGQRMLINILARRITGGASTITQQLARNLPVGLSWERTYSRKIKEAFIALQIERKFTKDEILELYLNQITLGWPARGVESGARKYFGKHVGELTLAECATLGAVANAPSRLDPERHPERAVRRRDYVLRLMLEAKYITNSRYREAINEPLTLRSYEAENEGFGDYFVEYVKQQLERTYGYERVYRGGLIVETTLDPAMQRGAEAAVKNCLARYTTLPGAAVYEDKQAQAALIAIQPSTGYIKAMVGGRDFGESNFNRTVQARRQPGSAFKPFIWAVALEKGFTVGDTFDDFPFYYPYRDPGTGEQVEWCPENFEEEYFGVSTLRQALVRSQNVVAVRLLTQTGLGPVIRLAHRAGIASFIDRNYSIALGTAVVTPLELASAYGTFANNGYHCTPLAILRVRDADGKILEENVIEEREAIRPEIAYLVTHLLQAVIEDGPHATGREARAFTRSSSNKIIRPAGGKTGTTENCVDAWFVGFTPELVAAVWVGYDDNSSLGKKITGGRVAAPAWAEFMLKALGDKPPRDFGVPEHVVFVDCDSDEIVEPTGPMSRMACDAYLEGTEPKASSSS